MSKNKIKFVKDLKEIVSALKKNNRKVVFTNGCFDIIHLGHVRYLEDAKKFGDILIVGLNSDESVKSIKGKSRPLISQDERAEILAALETVDFVAIFNEDTPEDLISQLKPDIHVKGGDYTPGQLPESKIVESYGGRVEIVKLVEGSSTTGLIEKIKSLP